jgi:hypothetical protein
MKMTEQSIRKYHGKLGLLLSVFIIIQVGSGTLIALTTLIMQEPHTHAEYSQIDVHKQERGDKTPHDDDKILETIHHHGEPIYQVFRVFLGIGIIAMVISGLTMSRQTKKRKIMRLNKIMNQGL